MGCKLINFNDTYPAKIIIDAPYGDDSFELNDKWKADFTPADYELFEHASELRTLCSFLDRHIHEHINLHNIIKNCKSILFLGIGRLKDTYLNTLLKYFPYLNEIHIIDKAQREILLQYEYLKFLKINNNIDFILHLKNIFDMPNIKVDCLFYSSIFERSLFTPPQQVLTLLQLLKISKKNTLFISYRGLDDDILYWYWNYEFQKYFSFLACIHDLLIFHQLQKEFSQEELRELIMNDEDLLAYVRKMNTMRDVLD
ncbi:hypothetical protein ACFL56_01875 [Candidatus Margulisiibacteriota bacterium]